MEVPLQWAPVSFSTRAHCPAHQCEPPDPPPAPHLGKKRKREVPDGSWKPHSCVSKSSHGHFTCFILSYIILSYLILFYISILQIQLGLHGHRNHSITLLQLLSSGHTPYLSQVWHVFIYTRTIWAPCWVSQLIDCAWCELFSSLSFHKTTWLYCTCKALARTLRCWNTLLAVSPGCSGPLFCLISGLFGFDLASRGRTSLLLFLSVSLSSCRYHSKHTATPQRCFTTELVSLIVNT